MRALRRERGQGVAVSVRDERWTGVGAPAGPRAPKRWMIDWQEYLDRKVLLDRAKKARIDALKELYDRYGLRLPLAEERLPETDRRALVAHISGASGGG